ncbi:MAG: hypothetical protein RJB66_873 [Pseudomonadota bacterium]|jgi:phenylpropionate dioxygenase-like ring-hydroxylating dioxygenase large terminal subunit
MNKLEFPRGWWLIAASDELKPKKPLALKRFGLDLVLWRAQNGQIHAVKDLCPHRSIKLSLGKVTEDCIECPFHGLRYAGNGECQFVPEVEKAAPQIKVASFHVVEFESYLWLWWDEINSHAAPQGTPQWFDGLPKKALTIEQTDQAQCHVTRAIENQLDFNHLSFVHRRSIGRFSDPRKIPYFKLEEESLQYAMSKELDKPPYIAFKLPNIWLNAISPRFMMTLGFTPIDQNTTQFYMRTYQNFLPIPLLGHFLMLILRRTNRWVLGEDLRIVNSHPEGQSLDFDSYEKLLGTDRAIRHFRTIWKKVK